MGEEDARKTANDEEEKSSISVHAEPIKAIVPVATPVTESEKTKPYTGSIDRDILLAKVEQDKRFALVKAWEDTEKSKAENKACKKLSTVDSWENTKKASIQSQLRKFEEKMERKKAEAAEKMKNMMAQIHKEAEEKRAMVEAKKGEEFLKAEELAAKYRATSKTPKKMIGCFSSP